MGRAPERCGPARIRSARGTGARMLHSKLESGGCVNLHRVFQCASEPAVLNPSPYVPAQSSMTLGPLCTQFCAFLCIQTIRSFNILSSVFEVICRQADEGLGQSVSPSVHAHLRSANSYVCPGQLSHPIARGLFPNRTLKIDGACLGTPFACLGLTSFPVTIWGWGLYLTLAFRVWYPCHSILYIG